MRSDQAAPVAPAIPAGHVGRDSAVRRALAHPRAPLVALLLGSLALAAVVGEMALRVSSWALDETIVKQSAVHYTDGLPGTLFHDLNARATSRLFSLLLMPIFAIWDGDTAVRLARAFATLLFCSTSIPVYLLARRVLRNPWHAAGAGLLAIAAPWVTIATTIYTENLAYPLFVWTLLAMVWATERQTPRADLLVVGAIVLSTVTRVQMFALLPAWLITVWVVAYGRSGDMRGLARRAWKMAPISHGLLGLFLLAALARMATGHLHADVQQLLGAYSELQDRGHVSADTLLAVIYEVQALALPAFLAAAASLAWFAGTLRSARESPLWSFAAVALCVTVVLWVVSAYVQGGWLSDRTEERYFFYLFPLVWIGAFAALEQPAVARPRLLAAAIPLVMLFAVMGGIRPLDPQSTFLAPATSSVRSIFDRVIVSWNLDGLTHRDAIALIAMALLAAGLAVWSRWPRGRLFVFVGVSAVLQLAVTAYALAARDGHVPGVPGQTGGLISLNAWVDHAAGNNEAVFLNNQAYRVEPSAEGWQYPTLLWNSKIRSWAYDQQNREPVPLPVPTIAALPLRDVTFEPTIGLVRGLERSGPFVSWIQSPFWQVAGQRIGKGPANRLELIAPTQPVQALWRTDGLQFDGSVADKVVGVDAWMPPGADSQRLRITIDLENPANAEATLGVELGDEQRDVKLAAGEKRTEVFTPCVDGRHLRGRIRRVTGAAMGDGRSIGGRIVAVRVSAGEGNRGC